MENKKMSPGKGNEAKVNTKVLLEVNEVVKTTLRVEQDVLTKEARIVCIRNANHTNEGPISMFSYKSLQNQFKAKLVMPSPIKAMLRDSTLPPKSFAKVVEPSTKHITSAGTDIKKVVSLQTLSFAQSLSPQTITTPKSVASRQADSIKSFEAKLPKVVSLAAETEHPKSANSSNSLESRPEVIESRQTESPKSMGWKSGNYGKEREAPKFMKTYQFLSNCTATVDGAKSMSSQQSAKTPKSMEQIVKSETVEHPAVRMAKEMSNKASDNQPGAAAEPQPKSQQDSAHKWIASVKTADTAQVAADEPKSAPEKVVEPLKTITSMPLSKSPTSAFPFSTNRKSLHSFTNSLVKAPQSVSHKTIISLKDTPEVVTVMSPASTQTVEAPFENVQTASIERFKSTIAATRGRQLEPVMLDSYTPTVFKVENSLLENQETSAPSTLEPTLKLEAEDMVLLTNTNQVRVAEIHPVALTQYTLKETSPMPVHNVKDLSPNSRMDMNMQKTLLE